MEFQEDALERAKRVKLIIFDVDGVLTDGGIYIGADGELFKPFFCRDGLGITLAHRAGLKTAIITGRQSEHLRYRAKELHITEVYQGNLDKREAYRDLKAKLGLADEEIAYFGDDLVDLPIMGQVGFRAGSARGRRPAVGLSGWARCRAPAHRVHPQGAGQVAGPSCRLPGEDEHGRPCPVSMRRRRHKTEGIGGIFSCSINS